MAEVLIIAGGIASFSRLLSNVIGTIEVITTFCGELQDAPSELYRVKK